MNRTDSFILGLVFVAGVAAFSVPEPAKEISAPTVECFGGEASAVDGDTLRLGSQRVRLWGMDAPEAEQPCRDATGRPWPCGVAAAAILRDMLGRDSNVSCTPKATDRYGRIVAVCANNDGDLGGRMVALGLAVDYPRYSSGYYRDHEAAAKAEHLGVWAGTFDMPWDWRKEHPQR